MNDFDKLVKEFEEIDPITYADILVEKSKRILPVLVNFSADGLTGVSIFSSFIFAAVASDGKLSEEEYALLYPALHAFLGDNLDYDSCVKTFKELRKEGKELKRVVDDMVDLLGLFSEDIKADIIVVCMLICAIDGKISFKEKAWIKQLIK